MGFSMILVFMKVVYTRGNVAIVLTRPVQVSDIPGCALSEREMVLEDGFNLLQVTIAVCVIAVGYR